jgi:hypothetical protein
MNFSQLLLSTYVQVVSYNDTEVVTKNYNTLMPHLPRLITTTHVEIYKGKFGNKERKNTKNSKYSTPSRFNPVPENSCRYQLQIEPELPKRDKT